MKRDREFKTDLDALRSMKDDEIDYSDLPPLDDALLEKGFTELPHMESSVA
jgi:hypothetical protein